MQPILQSDGGLSARRHVAHVQLDHGNVSVCGLGRTPRSSLGTRVSVRSRVRVRRIRDCIIQPCERRGVDAIVVHRELRNRGGLRNAAALIAVLLARLRHRDIDFPVVGRICVIAGQKDLCVKNVRIVVQVSALNTGRTLLEGLVCLREGKQTKRGHLINLVRCIVRRIEHLCLVCARACLCSGRISELRTAWLILHQLIVVVCGLDIHPLCVAAVAVTVGIKLGVEPDTRHRFQNHRVCRVVRLELKSDIVVPTVHTGRKILIRKSEFTLRRLIGRNDEYTVIRMAGLTCPGARRDKIGPDIVNHVPTGSAAGRIGAVSLDLRTVINIGKALIDFKIIGRASLEPFCCDQISCVRIRRKGQASAYRELASLIGICASVAELV